MFVFLLSGLFGCFGFSVVCCLGGCLFYFCCLGGGGGPAQTAKKKKKKRPCPNSKEINTPPTLPSVFVLLFGRVGVFIFLLFGRVACFLAVWAECVFLLLFGRGRVHFFAVWAKACFFCCLGGVHVFFAVWAGDGSSLTYRSAGLVFKGPNNKKKQNKKKKTHTHTRVPIVGPRSLGLGLLRMPKGLGFKVYCLGVEGCELRILSAKRKLHYTQQTKS